MNPTPTNTPKIKVEFFNKVNDRTKHRSAELDKILSWAKSDLNLKKNTEVYRKFLKDNPKATTKEIGIKKRETFHAVTFGGTFFGTGKDEELKEISGLICLDFDHLSEHNINVKEKFEELKNDISTFLLFISPSCDGLKLIVRHDLKQPDKFGYLYEELAESYLKRFEIIADESCKNISRMCFLPYVDNLHERYESTVYEYKGTFENRIEYVDEIQEYNVESTNELYQECYHKSVFLVDNDINLTEDHEDWISYGFSLATFGEKGKQIYHNISSVSDKYNEAECDIKYDQLLNDFNGDKTGINKYLIKVNEAIAKIVNEKIKTKLVLPEPELYNKLPVTLRTPLMKFNDAPKFMALLANMGNISGIIPNIKFIHDTKEYEGNLFVWIIAKSSSGKGTINDAKMNFSSIEKKIDNEFAIKLDEYEQKKALALSKNEIFTEQKPKYKTLYIGADVTKAAFVKDLKGNKGRAIILTTEAKTLLVSNSTPYGGFMDVLLASWEHEAYQKNLTDATYKIPETFLSLVLGSTPDTAYQFFNHTNTENGMLSRFFAFYINTKNELKEFVKNPKRKELNDTNDTNKDIFLHIWQECNELKSPVYLDITTEIDHNIYLEYKQFENEIKYIYKFCNEDVPKRMWITHKKILTILSFLYYYEKIGKLNPDTNEIIPVDQRAIEITNILMEKYRDAFITLSFEIEKHKHKNMLISVRNDTIKRMKLEGYTNEYLAMLFKLPIGMILEQNHDGRVKFTDEQKEECINFCEQLPDNKKIAAKLMGITTRAIEKWIKNNGENKSV